MREPGYRIHKLDYILGKLPIQKECRQTGEATDSCHCLLVAKICTRLEKIVKFRKGKPRCDLKKLYSQRQQLKHALEEKLGVTECESGNVEVQQRNLKKYVLHPMSDLVGKVDRSATKPLITQEMISKMDN